MAAPIPASIHVGDIGTLFKGKIQDNGVPFNPNSATVKKLIFKLASGVAIERSSPDVTVTTDGTDWYLEYTTTAADIAAGINATAGQWQWQGFVEFILGNRYWTNVRSYTVSANL